MHFAYLITLCRFFWFQFGVFYFWHEFSNAKTAAVLFLYLSVCLPRINCNIRLKFAYETTMNLCFSASEYHHPSQFSTNLPYTVPCTGTHFARPGGINVSRSPSRNIYRDVVYFAMSVFFLNTYWTKWFWCAWTKSSNSRFHGLKWRLHTTRTGSNCACLNFWVMHCIACSK